MGARPPDPREIYGEAKQIWSFRKGWDAPVEGEREEPFVRRVLVLRQSDHSVFEIEQHPRLHLESKMEVDRPAATFLRMKVYLPELAQGVRLDKVPLVVHMELVVDCMVFQLGHIARDIDDGHSAASLGERPGTGGHATVRCCGRSRLAGDPRGGS